MGVVKRLIVAGTACAVGAAVASPAGAADPFTIAGTDSHLPGDAAVAGPATRHQLDPVAIATAADGSTLVLEDDALHRVDASGRIERVATGFTATDVAPLPDGGALLAEPSTGRVLRTTAGGTVSVAAAGLARPTHVAAVPGGGLLVAELDARRIRRVAADGAMSTAAGPAGVRHPSSIVTLEDGGFVFLDAVPQRIRHVTAHGTMSTDFGTGAPGPPDAFELGHVLDLAPARGGGYLIGTHAGIRHARANGSAKLVTRLHCFPCDDRQVAQAADGGLLISERGRVRYAPPSRSLPRLLGVDLPDDPLPPARRVRLPLRSTLRGTALVEVFRGNRRVATFRRRIAPGRNVVAVPRGLDRDGPIYRFDVTVRARGALAFDRTAVFAPGRLTKTLAAHAASTTGPCRRMSEHRIDCAVLAADGGCSRAASVTRFPRTPRLAVRSYDCPVRRRRPEVTSTPVRLTPLDFLRAGVVR